MSLAQDLNTDHLIDHLNRPSDSERTCEMCAIQKCFGTHQPHISLLQRHPFLDLLVNSTEFRTRVVLLDGGTLRCRMQEKLILKSAINTWFATYSPCNLRLIIPSNIHNV
jgi:hypothetical protein